MCKCTYVRVYIRAGCAVCACMRVCVSVSVGACVLCVFEYMRESGTTVA